MYRVVIWLARRSTRWFYRNHELLNASAIPQTGATLLVASHGNDLPDILLTFLTTKRRVRFIANVAAADSIIVQWVYSGIGVIPVARTRDARAAIARGEDVVALNSRAFESVTAAFKRGECVAIFPEGVVNDFPHLSPMRTGAARMALDAIAAGVPNLSVVAIGHQYEDPQIPRTDYLTAIGAPIRVENWRASVPQRAVSEFTRVIKDKLQELTRNSATYADAAKLSAIAAAIGAVTCAANKSPLVCSHEAQIAITNAQSRHGLFVSASSTSAPAEIELENAAAALTNRVSRFGVRPRSSYDHAIALRAAGEPSVVVPLPSVARLVALAPVAIAGWIWHAIPIGACHAQGKRFAPLAVEVSARTIVPGLYLIALWYVTIPLALLWAGITPWLVLLLFLVQPRLGDVALRWRDDLRTRLLVWRVRRAATIERQRIISDANELRRLWASLPGRETRSHE
ncbi:MAG: 1-acyl-sn-glycerol-3-phosphate acyltransferase [Gemmatimonadaceae bacterium]